MVTLPPPMTSSGRPALLLSALLLLGSALTGPTLARAQTPADTAPSPVRLASTAFRTDAIDIPLASGDEAGHWLEWKARTGEGVDLLYSWTVTGVDNPDEFFVDFHGHTERPDAAREDSFRQVSGLSDAGALTTPFAGVHGWYFKNDSAGPVVVHLRVAGVYTPLTPEELLALQAEAEP